MSLRTAVLACAVLILIPVVVPPSLVISAATSSSWPLRALVLVAVLIDARRMGLHSRATGLGRWNWKFYIVLVLSLPVGIGWYLTIRERITSGATPRRTG